MENAFVYVHAESRWLSYDIKNFWSLGGQYQGLFEGGNDDVRALAYADADLSSTAGHTADESIWEYYFNGLITPWISVSPMIQYKEKPGVDSTMGNATVLSLRAQIALR